MVGSCGGVCCFLFLVCLFFFVFCLMFVGWLLVVG